jgi:small-conductance mechanosensitive channel
MLGALLIRRLHSQLPDLQFRGQGRPQFLISVTLGFWLASWFIPDAFNSVLIQTLIHAFLPLGLSLLIWRYRMATTAGATPSRNLMIPLWWLFTTSLVFQGLNLPESLLVSLWPFILLVFLFMLTKIMKSIHMGLERAIGFGALSSLIFLALVALSGWANLSLLFSNFLFVLALSLQFGAVATSLLKSRMAALPESNFGFLGQGLIQGTVLPLLWLLSISMAVIWLGIDMGDVQFLEEITALNIGWGVISINLFRLILVLVGFYLARSGLVVLRTVLDGMAQRQSHLDHGTTATLKTLLTYIVWAVFIVVALAFLGVNLTSLTVVAGGLSVGIGFGMQSIVNNFISGLILLFGRAIKPGDIVQIGDLWAEVKEVNIRTTVVETFDKSSLLLPNSKLIEEQIVNWTLSDKAVRRTITVGVAYGSDTELVKKLLLYMADTQPNVLKKPRPFARFIDFGASSLDFRLYFFAMIDNAWDTESDLRFEIDKVFREYDIEIAFPQQDLHVKSAKGLESLFPCARSDP